MQIEISRFFFNILNPRLKRAILYTTSGMKNWLFARGPLYQKYLYVVLSTQILFLTASSMDFSINMMTLFIEFW